LVGCFGTPPLFGEIMQRQHAIGYSKNAELANSRGVRPSHYAPGQISGARMVAGVSEWIDEVEPEAETEIKTDSFCAAKTKKGTDCKAYSANETEFCIGHLKQKAAS
jgi:hypothetical protein